jgi:predicted Zn-dependent protease
MTQSGKAVPAIGHGPGLAAVILLAAAAAGCAVNPVTGKSEVMLMSAEQETTAGRQAASEVERDIGLVRDPALTRYIDALGQRLAARSPRKDVQFSFFVADMPEPNAFALPGGYIYVSRGLLALANSEAELANVIGHEIGHVAARHAAQRQTRETGIGLAAVLGTILAGIAGGGEAAQAAAQLGQVAGAGLIASYSRDQERQADEIGQKLAAQAGWDPRAMSVFLATLLRDTATRQGGQLPRPGYLDSHPALDERVAVTAQRAAALTTVAAAPIAASTEDFYRRFDNVLVGDDPRNGIFRGSTFLHPDLNFAVVFPDGWNTRNQPTLLLAGSKERDALIRVEQQGPPGDPQAAARQFAESNRLVFQGVRVERIGGHPAVRAVAQGQTDQGQVGLDLTWISHPAGMFRLSGIAPVQRFSQHAADFAATARSFHDLSPAERAEITENRLRVVTGRRGETLAAAAARNDNRWSLEQTAVANNLPADAVLSSARPIKVVKAEPYRRAP